MTIVNVLQLNKIYQLELDFYENMIQTLPQEARLAFMILGIDAGNTRTSFGLFNSKLEPFCYFDLKTESNRTAFETLSFLDSTFRHLNIDFGKVSAVKIASVVPEVEREFQKLFEEICQKEVQFILPSDVPIKINLHHPTEVGIDRILGVFSALKIHGSKEDILIIDFGTAITFDIGLKNFCYEGGVIFPGISLSLEALKSGTSKLPKVSLKKPDSPVGKSTSEAINSGIFYGYSSMVNGVVKALKEEYKTDFKVIITGGYAEMLSHYFNFHFSIDDALVLKGISFL